VPPICLDLDDVDMVDPASSSSAPAVDKGKGVDRSDRSKRVSFASDTKPVIDVDADATVAAAGLKDEKESNVPPPARTVKRGKVGQLEVYADGSVKMRLGDIIMDVRTFCCLFCLSF
jgi:DNA-directed RNA polymerase III subunit RPC4